MIETFLEMKGRPVGMTFHVETMPAGIFGAVMAVRLLKRTHRKIRR